MKYYILPGKKNGESIKFYPDTGTVLPASADNVPVRPPAASVPGNHPALSELRFLSILPTSRCNFRCKYCYAAGEHSGCELAPAQIHGIIDFFLSPQRTAHAGHSITVIGGGEPLCRADLTLEAFEYAALCARRWQKNLDLTLVTNGSLLTGETVDFLLRNEIRTRISFEVLPEIQSDQRGNYETVARNIRAFCRAGGRPGIRTVLTPDHIEKLPDIVEKLHADYPEIIRLDCDPVTSNTYFPDPTSVYRFGEKFIAAYFAAAEKAAVYGINLQNMWHRQLFAGTASARFCPGEMSLSPDGSISLCHRISDRCRGESTGMVYGEVSPGGEVRIDENKFAVCCCPGILHSFCQECFLKEICKGGCRYCNLYYPPEVLKAFCQVRREFSLQVLQRRLNENH